MPWHYPWQSWSASCMLISSGPSGLAICLAMYVKNKQKTKFKQKYTKYNDKSSSLTGVILGTVWHTNWNSGSIALDSTGDWPVELENFVPETVWGGRECLPESTEWLKLITEKLLHWSNFSSLNFRMTFSDLATDGEIQKHCCVLSHSHIILKFCLFVFQLY